MDNIIISKIWEDEDIIAIKVTCSSSKVIATTKIYVCDSLIDELINQIKQFLNRNIDEGLWANEERGNFSTACVSFRFINKDKLGHILIEVFMEIDDDGDFTEHNCCFFISTEYGLLMKFCERLSKLKKNGSGYIIQLHYF